jgi:hypothetical protein
MILPKYVIAPSTIARAGKGLFLMAKVARGSIIVAPDNISRVFSFAEIVDSPNASERLPATVRWFQDCYTVSLDWPDECFINHSFSPSGLWHLGFIFAAIDLEVGDELTVDYRHLLAPGQHEEFVDAITGDVIVGLEWSKSLQLSTAALASLI